MPIVADSARRRGYFETTELREMNRLPPKERARKGRVAVIECIQEIPCNPCGFVCKFGAIRKETISQPPTVDWSKCTGCRQCIGICPGLAIFNIEIKDEKGYVTLPYELLPKPNKGDRVVVLNRKGEKVGLGKITQVFKQGKDESGFVVTVEVSKPELVDEVRAIRVIGK